MSRAEKTQFCQFGTKCTKQEKCSFAHTIDELRLIPCRFFETCRNGAKCGFLHKNETKTDFLKRTGRAPDVAEKRPNTERTKLCRVMRDREPCRAETCLYAHSVTSLVPVRCVTKRCVSETCPYFHADRDTMLEYYARFDKDFAVKPFMHRAETDNYKKPKSVLEMIDDLREEDIRRSLNELLVDNDPSDEPATKIPCLFHMSSEVTDSMSESSSGGVSVFIDQEMIAREWNDSLEIRSWIRELLDTVAL